MPEGDTIFRTARTLHKALAGRTVTHFTSVFPALTRVDHDKTLRGRLVQSVVPRGKHVLMSFSGGLVLRTHMRMHGSWHIYRPGERWMRPRHDMRIVIGTDAFEAVAFDVPVAEFLSEHDLLNQGGPSRAAKVLHELGPDIMSAEFDVDEAVRRIQARPEVEIADALLDQQAVAGIGNIFKSESLYACRVNPFVTVQTLSAPQIARVVASARALMRREPRGELRVYMRGGQPCRRCGSTIQRRKQGPHARSTYWCERCQRAAGPNGVTR
jgi:endonuclease-8